MTSKAFQRADPGTVPRLECLAGLLNWHGSILIVSTSMIQPEADTPAWAHEHTDDVPQDEFN